MPTPKPWSEINDELCTFAQFDKHFKSLGVVLGKDASTLFAFHRDEGKGWIRKRLILQWQKNYDKTPRELYLSALSRYNHRRQMLKLAEDSTKYEGVYSLSTGTWYDAFVSDLESPLLFTNAGTPTSATRADEAQNGDWLVNTERNGWLYINRGTPATPDWQRWDVHGLIDYIQNPQELGDVGYAATLLSVYKRNEKPSEIADYDWDKIKSEMTVQANTDYETHLAVAQGLVRPDISGDGLLSNFELERQDNTGFFLYASG
jgi:hypothetical protein